MSSNFEILFDSPRHANPEELELDGFRDLAAKAGYAISAWNVVEERLFKIYYAINFRVGIPTGAPAAFLAINSFATRLQVLTRLMQESFLEQKHEAMHERWRAISNRLLRHSRKRNEVAHGTGVCEITEKGTLFHWVPGFDALSFDLRSNSKAPAHVQNRAKRLSTDCLIQYREKFEELRDEVEHFFVDFRETLERPAEFSPTDFD